MDTKLFERFQGTKYLGFDCETYDPRLKKKGAGGARGDGFLVGVSLATEQGDSVYFPIAHRGGGNMPKRDAVYFLREALSNPNSIKVGANLVYDLEWLRTEGIRVLGPMRDVQIVEALLDEERPCGYSLDRLAKDYLGVGKAFEGLGSKGRSGLWELHASYVQEYARMDALYPIRIFEKQRTLIRQEKLRDVMELECDLIPLIHEMRWRGVRVDVRAAGKLRHELMARCKVLQKELVYGSGIDLNVWSEQAIAKYCRQERIEFVTTDKNNPSFKQDWLAAHPDPVLQKIATIRKLDKLVKTFLQGVILDNHVRGRIYATIHQCASDEGGVRTGRMSTSKPNLLGIPSADRDPVWGAKLRGLFLPEEGQEWAKLDYSQQEPRLVVHYALKLGLPGAEELAEEYRKNPHSDIYEPMARRASIERKPAKSVVLGRLYGLGIASLARQLGVSPPEARGLAQKFNQQVPFLSALFNLAEKEAQDLGFITTLLGRRRRFNLWTPAERATGAGRKCIRGSRLWSETERQRSLGLRREAAEELWGADTAMVRARTYKALNARIQGSAADVTKKAMLVNFRERSMVPMIQVHDELDYSVLPHQAEGLVEGMETAMPIEIPWRVDVDLGATWV